MQQKNRLFSLIFALISSLTLAAFWSMAGWFTVNGQSGPLLQVADGLVVTESAAVTVPISYQSNGAPIAAAVFSLNYDEQCLALDPRDENRDGRPDAIALDLPAGLAASVIHNPADTDGEIDVLIADYFPPFAILTDRTALLTITFDTICVPPAGGMRAAAIAFAADPSPSFGNTAGQSVVGVTTGSTVTILSNRPAPTVTPTANASPTVTPTPTVAPTAPPTTPTATPTLVPTAVPATVVEWFTAEVQETGILLRWQTSREVNTQSFAIHRLPLGQANSFIPISSAVASQSSAGGTYTFLDDQIDANSQYSYLLVEEKRNGRFVAYYDRLILAGPLAQSTHQLLLPLIRR